VSAPVLLSRPAALAIARAAAGGASVVDVSLDLGRSERRVALEGTIVRFPDGQSLTLGELEVVVETPASVFLLEADRLEKVSWFSEETGKVYTLRATAGWPALEISGILMHRVKDTDPGADARSKLAALGPARGHGLDTCCGLGYSAIHAARTADRVLAFEIDPNVLGMARLNPYSAPLFEEGGRIEVRNEDVAEAIRDLPAGAFDFVLHDPPTLAVAGELYGGAFYRQLHRVLRPGGRLFHYTGDPGSRHRRQDLPGRVAQRLADIGFTRVRRQPAALGVSARKD
jgi:uncharacterized protein